MEISPAQFRRLVFFLRKIGVGLVGEPLGEPVAWIGPIVMNTEAELEEAFKELESGTFIKSKRLWT